MFNSPPTGTLLKNHPSPVILMLSKNIILQNFEKQFYTNEV